MKLADTLNNAFHRSQTTEYRVLNGVIWVLILVSLLLFGAEAHMGKRSPSWLHTMDTAILLIFSLELLLRVLSYRPPALKLFSMSPRDRLREHLRGRFRFCLRPITLIDIVTVAALIPHLRGLRVVRILRLVRTWKVFRYSDPVGNITRVFRDNGLLYSFAFSLLGMAVLLGGVSLYLVEAGVNPRLHSVADGVWWALVTITTVGFGDISPVTTAGRVVGGALMVCGLFTIALFAGIIGQTLLSAVLTIREEQFRMSNFADHVIICGYGPRADMLLDAVRKEINLVTTPVLIFSVDDRPPEVDPEFFWIRGDPTKESELDKVHIAQARAVILVGSRQMSPQQADAVTILTAFTIRSRLSALNQERPRVRPVYIVAEILDSENVRHALAAGANEVIETNQLAFSLMSHSVTVPGSAAVTSSVVRAEATNIYVGELPDRLELPIPFGALIDSLREDRVLVIGVRSPDQEDMLNPPDHMEISEAHRIIYLAERPLPVHKQ